MTEAPAPTGTLSAWVASDMLNVSSLTPAADDPIVFDAAAKTVRLFAAANETISFQVVVDAGAGGVQDLRLALTDLSAGKEKISPDRATVFRCLPVKVSNYPTWYLRMVDQVPAEALFYDALAPLGTPAKAPALKVEPRQRLVLWIDLAVPRDTAGGTYTGTLTLSARATGGKAVPLRLRVYDFVLPDSRPMPAVGAFDHDALYRAFVRRDGKPYEPFRMDRTRPLVREGLLAMRHLMRLAHEHRLDLFDKQIRPILKRDLQGKVRLGWEDFDSIVKPYLDGTAFDDRLGCAAWPVPAWDTWPDPRRYGGPGGAAYRTMFDQLARGACEHFRDTLGAEKQMFVWPWRGSAGQEGYDRLGALAGAVRKADPGVPILSTLPLQPPKLTGWHAPKDLSSRIDILAPPAEFMEPLQARALRRQGQPLAGAWLAPGQPPYLPSLGVIATPADVRAVPWFAVKYGFAGLFLPDVLHWDGSALSVHAGAQTRLFYPGTTAGIQRALPSVRLKRLRRGLQDIAYLALLRARRPAAADALVGAMVRYAGADAIGDHYLDPRLEGWVQDPHAWELARKLLAEEIQAAFANKPPGPRELFARKLEWRDLQQRTRNVVIEQIRTRVLPTDDPQTVRAVVWLDVYNQFGASVDFRATLGKLPAGWQPVQSPVHVPNFSPTSRRVIELTARGNTVPQGSTGKIALPIRIEIAGYPTREVVVPVCFVVAAPMAQPPRIDGVLDDWPAHSRNTAGRFRLIGRRGRVGEGLARRQTSVFVLYDEKHLYLAFRCDEPTPGGIVSRPGNALHYEQLIACGEDMVEVLLDPGAAAKGPGDLYHLAVKPNGVLIAERGVRTDPPLGPVAPWPAAVRVAVGREKAAWVVEMAIPLSALGPRADALFWGMNFMRFSVQGGESSNWSEAPRYYYHPRNLGTVYVPRRKSP